MPIHLGYGTYRSNPSIVPARECVLAPECTTRSALRAAHGVIVGAPVRGRWEQCEMDSEAYRNITSTHMRFPFYFPLNSTMSDASSFIVFGSSLAARTTAFVTSFLSFSLAGRDQASTIGMTLLTFTFAFSSVTFKRTEILSLLEDISQ